MKCVVCQGEMGRVATRVCQSCDQAGRVWAARMAHGTAKAWADNGFDSALTDSYHKGVRDGLREAGVESPHQGDGLESLHQRG